jgi:glutamine amidotransferase
LIAIIDYGMGNLHSVSKAVERLGYECIVTADADVIMQADKAILPGVGAFGDAMQYLRESGLQQAWACSCSSRRARSMVSMKA